MSLNKHVDPGIALYHGESIIMDSEGVELVFKKFSHSCEHLKGKKHGHVYLTNFRLLFVNGQKSDMLHQLSMPFPQIKDFELKQPVFGANYLQGRLLAERNGGWQGSGSFTMTFSSGGAIDIGRKLVALATKPPRKMFPQTAVVYPSDVVQGFSGVSAVYAFPAPSAPPMYTGPVNPPAYSQQSMYNGSPSVADAKQAEASSSNLPPQYSDEQAPPKYDEINGKNF